MSDYREIEVVISVIGTKENPTTEEPGNKVVPVRKLILVDENLSVEDVAKMFSQAITRIEEEN